MNYLYAAAVLGMPVIAMSAFTCLTGGSTQKVFLAAQLVLFAAQIGFLVAGLRQ